MDVVWIIAIVAALAVAVPAVFALIRSRQRSGSVLATPQENQESGQ